MAPGQVLGLVGESGSGKSTVGVALLGLARKGLRIAGGRVSVGGVDILALAARNYKTPAADSRVRSAGPASGLNPALRVGRQLRESIIIHGDALLDGRPSTNA